MAAPPLKSQPLHNFSLSHLKWARKDSSPSSSHHHRFRRRDSPDQNRRSCPDPESEPENRRANPKQQQPGNEEEKRLKLRPRKEAVKTAPCTKSAAADSDCKNRGNDNNGVKSQRIKGSECERNSKRRIWISLSKEEIEEDVYALTGGKPARRPRKWPKNVQKQLDVWWICFILKKIRSVFSFNL